MKAEDQRARVHPDRIGPDDPRYTALVGRGQQTIAGDPSLVHSTDEVIDLFSPRAIAPPRPVNRDSLMVPIDMRRVVIDPARWPRAPESTLVFRLAVELGRHGCHVFRAAPYDEKVAASNSCCVDATSASSE